MSYTAIVELVCCSKYTPTGNGQQRMPYYLCPIVKKIMKHSAKNIKATLQLFGYNETAPSYFVSNGSGIVVHPQEAFRADFYVYAICTAGHADVHINNEPVRIVPNTFFTAIPSTILKVIRHTPNFKASVLVFERSFLLKNILDARQLEHLGFFKFGTVTQLPFTTEEVAQLSVLFEQLYQKSLQQGIFHREIMQSLIIHLLFETAEIYTRYRNESRRQTLTRKEELFISFMKLVQVHFRQVHTLQFYADQLFISKKYLEEVCKYIAGKTPGSIIAQALLNEAKLLLNNPDNNVSMVSRQLHYGSIAAFSKFFKHHTGLSPLLWKAQKSV